MTSTRIPSEAELIELENWFGLLQDRFERAWVDWANDDFTINQWRARYPELPLNEASRDRIITNVRMLFDLARTARIIENVSAIVDLPHTIEKS